MKIYFTSFIVGLSTFFSANSIAQDFVPGESYLDENGYVEYIPGNLPIILSAPHGGYLEPDSIPDRDCDGCLYLRDSYTQELTRELQSALFELTGCYPHVIINLLHRKKFDANRSVETAADGNTYVEASWENYHDFIDTAKAKIAADYQRGLFLDMHGHAHEIERIELGYLLSRSELQMTDEDLNGEDLIEESSIRALAGDNLESLNHSYLLRGSNSMGTLLHEQGFPSVPSSEIPFPAGEEPYFTGGYNTAVHGSRDGGEIDAIQFEFNSDVRFDAETRNRLADSLALSLIHYIETHYHDLFETYFCTLPSLDVSKNSKSKLQIYPNPANSTIHIESETEIAHITLFNMAGNKILSANSPTKSIDISHLNDGLYLIQIETKLGVSHFERIIIRK